MLSSRCMNVVERPTANAFTPCIGCSILPTTHALSAQQSREAVKAYSQTCLFGWQLMLLRCPPTRELPNIAYAVEPTWDGRMTAFTPSTTRSSHGLGKLTHGECVHTVHRLEYRQARLIMVDMMMRPRHAGVHSLIAPQCCKSDLLMHSHCVSSKIPPNSSCTRSDR